MESDSLKTLLLVEDELIIAMAEAELLRGRGFAVAVAGSGEEALQIALWDRRIDLILMDIDQGRGMDILYRGLRGAGCASVRGE
ncbi:MAG: hypothetical protein JXA20_15795 [Spirochaetes bacterium]|nr:hypothetical protein [Spirochaetota bacterium]